SRTQQSRSDTHRALNLPDVCVCAGLVGLQVTVGLEVLVGKNPIIEVLNGTDVLLPCTFTSCMGHKNAIFWWTYQLNKTMKGEKAVIPGTITQSHIEQEDRIKFVGDIDKNNISLLLDQVDFEDSGLYTCSFKNPNERNQIVNATIKLIIVSECKSGPPTQELGSVGGGACVEYKQRQGLLGSSGLFPCLC
uniref:Ig-like domain-containing protein n=1 Tax=Callorhinchus milii TaxID=7868 RepID=A0A4W3HF57_CALMI